MPIVKTDVPMTYRLARDTAEEITCSYPVCRKRVLTATAFGREIEALSIGSGDRTVLFTAAHHANEWITAPVLLKFLEDLAAADEAQGTLFGVPTKTILNAATIFAVPMVNPDGVDLVTGAIEAGVPEYKKARQFAENYPAIPFPKGWKANLLGVDLNLQYPAGWLKARNIKFSQGYTRPGPRDFVGRAPLNQREAIALARYTLRVDPALVIALHTQGKAIYWKFQEDFVAGAQELGAEFARLSGYALEDTPYNSSFAGYKDWFIKVWRRPGYTVECGSGQNPLPLSQFGEIYRAVLGILVTGATGLPG